MDKYLELKEKFEANRDDENAVKMAAYMRNLFSFYGLSTPKRKAIYRDFLKSEKRKKIEHIGYFPTCSASILNFSLYNLKLSSCSILIKILF